MSKATKRLAAQEEQVTALRAELNTTHSAYALLERRLDDMTSLDLSGSLTWAAGQDETLPRAKQVETIMRLRRLRHENPIAKQSVKLTLRFVFGKGVSYLAKEPRTQEFLDTFWNDKTNQQVLTSRNAMIMRFDETLTDGEFFPVLFDAPIEPYVRLGRIPMEEVTDILYDPDNAEVAVWYKRVYRTRKYDPTLYNGLGGWELNTDPLPTVRYYRDYRISDEALTDIEGRGLTIPEGKIAEGKVMHRLINPVRMKSGWRGVSELFSSREWFRVFKEFMEDRGAINAAANALSFKRKIKGGPTTVASFSNRLGGVRVAPDKNDSMDGDSFLRLTRPAAGAIYDENEGVDLTGQRVDTGATHAERDARMILMAGGAGVGIPVTYFGEGSAALASAQVMELPVVKAYEDWQTFQASELQEMVAYMLEQAYGRPPTIRESQIAWIFPPIITQDVVKWTSAYAQLAQQIAPGNNRIRRIAIRGGMAALNVPNADMEMDEIDVEEKRIADEKKVAQQLQLDAQKKALTAPVPVPGAPVGAAPGANGKTGSNGNGQTAGGGEKPSALSPQMTRLQAGRPPGDTSSGPRGRRQ